MGSGIPVFKRVATFRTFEFLRSRSQDLLRFVLLLGCWCVFCAYITLHAFQGGTDFFHFFFGMVIHTLRGRIYVVTRLRRSLF